MPDWRIISSGMGALALAAIGFVALRIFRNSRKSGIDRGQRRASEHIDGALEKRLAGLDRLLGYDKPDAPSDVESPTPRVPPQTPSPDPPNYTEDTLLNIRWKWDWRRGPQNEWEVCELKPYCAQPACNCSLVALSSRSQSQGERTVFLCASRDYGHAVPFEGSETDVRIRVQQLIERSTEHHSKGETGPGR